MKWLRELVPSRYASYPVLHKHPVLLARHAQLQVQQEMRIPTALQTARSELPGLGLHEGVIEHTIKLYAAKLTQLQHIARSIRTVSQALVDHPTRGTEPSARSGNVVRMAEPGAIAGARADTGRQSHPDESPGRTHGYDLMDRGHHRRGPRGRPARRRTGPAGRLVRTRRDLRRAGCPRGPSGCSGAPSSTWCCRTPDLVPDPVYLDDIGVMLLALRSMRSAAAPADPLAERGNPKDRAVR